VLSASGTGGGSLDDPVALNMLGRRTGRRWATSRDGERCRARHVRRECSCETASLGVTPTSSLSKLARQLYFSAIRCEAREAAAKGVFPLGTEKRKLCVSRLGVAVADAARGGGRPARPSKWLSMQS
jgi:hypothetical protein